MGMQRFRSPALPLAPLEYDQQHMAQLIGALRLYFTQLDSNVPLQMEATAIKFANIGVQFARRHSLSGWRVLKSSPAKLCLCTRGFRNWGGWQCHNSNQHCFSSRNICNR